MSSVPKMLGTALGLAVMTAAWSVPAVDSASTPQADPTESSSKPTCARPTTGQVASFPLRTSEDGLRVTDATGQPWLLVGDAGWSSAVMLDENELNEYFDGLAAKRFNAVLVSLIENTYSDYPPLNAAGDAPFTGDMYRSEPNEVYWSWIDHYIEAAAARGILVLAVPAYLGYAGDGEAANIEAASVDQMREFGAFLGARYTNQPNIVWVIGGDRTAVSDELLVRMDALALGITESATQLLTAHTADDTSAADIYGQFNWLAINTTYETGGRVVDDALAAYTQAQTRPFFSIEGIYEQERSDPLAPGHRLLRYQAYGAVLTGAFGHVFGNNPRWSFGSGAALYPYEGTWQESLDDADGRLDLGTLHMCLFAQILDDVPWWQMQPDTPASFLISGGGADTTRVAAAYDPTSGWAAAYAPGTETLQFDLSILAAANEVVVRRIDPTTSIDSDVGRFPAAETITIDHPGPNANGDDDWFYLFEPTGA